MDSVKSIPGWIQGLVVLIIFIGGIVASHIHLADEVSHSAGVIDEIKVEVHMIYEDLDELKSDISRLQVNTGSIETFLRHQENGYRYPEDY